MCIRWKRWDQGLKFFAAMLLIGVLTLAFPVMLARAEGWVHDEAAGAWFYKVKHPEHGEYQLKRSWHDDIDGYRYYLDPVTGAMKTGYHVLDGKLYLFKDEPKQGNYRQDDGEFWRYHPNGRIPYGALLAMWATADRSGAPVKLADGVDAAELLRIREGSGPAKRTEIREDGRVPEEQIVKGRVYAAPKSGGGSGGASKRDNAHIRHEEEDNETKGDPDDQDNVNSGDDEDREGKDETDPQETVDGSDTDTDGKEKDSDGDSRETEKGSSDEGGIGNKHGEGIPCIAEDSLETIFENLETDTHAYDACIEAFCLKQFALEPAGFEEMKGDPDETKIKGILRNFGYRADEEEGDVELIPVEAALYRAEENALRFVTMGKEDALRLPMHTGFHYLTKDEGIPFYGDTIADSVETFTNYGGVPYTLPFGLFHGMYLSYSYRDDEDSEPITLAVSDDGCSLYEEASGYQAVEELLTSDILYDWKHPSSASDEAVEEVTKFFIPSEEELSEDEDLRRALLRGTDCWLRNLHDAPDDSYDRGEETESYKEWKKSFLALEDGEVKERRMSEALPVRFYFIVQGG